MTGIDVLVAVSIAVGLVGVVVPLLPGALLVWSAIVVWGFSVGTATGWAVVGVATALRAVGVSMLLELTSAMLAAAVWIIGVSAT
mgnify:CR=1 FL=1